nr:MAG TPA: hypothetical protein [Caudoviricetes sp.]
MVVSSVLASNIVQYAHEVGTRIVLNGDRW